VEIEALGAWTNAIYACSETLAEATSATISGMRTSIEASWYDDLAVFVKLDRHQIGWSEAASDLKRNTIKRRTEVAARADKIPGDLDKMSLARYNRCTEIITSIIGIVP